MSRRGTIYVRCPARATKVPLAAAAFAAAAAPQAPVVHNIAARKLCTLHGLRGQCTKLRGSKTGLVSLARFPDDRCLHAQPDLFHLLTSDTTTSLSSLQ